MLNFVWPIAIIVNRDHFFVTMFLLGWLATSLVMAISKYLRRWRTVTQWQRVDADWVRHVLVRALRNVEIHTVELYYRGPYREVKFIQRQPGDNDMVDYELWHGRVGRWILDEIIPLATVDEDYKAGVPFLNEEGRSYKQEVATLQFGKRWRLRIGGKIHYKAAWG